MGLLDLTNVSESSVEPGEYKVTCTEAVVKETKAGTGEYIKCKFETSSGVFVFHNFNIKNPNEQAVKIGLGQLKTFMRVAGKKDPNTLGGAGELEGLQCRVKIKIVDNDYGSNPQISSFKALVGADATSATPNVVPF